MIVCIAGVKGGADLSGYVERDTGTFEIDAAVGKRMDTLRMTLFDPNLEIVPGDRAEVWIYDALAGAAVTDPPTAISAYNTFLNGAGNEVTSTNPASWTTRLFAGYMATPIYTVLGAHRYTEIDAQDYTYRLRTTVCNKAYAGGQTDQAIVQDIFTTYRPDVDVSGVAVTVTSMPGISFPVHTLEQFLERVVKISRAVYRVDYYKRLQYGMLGQVLAPFNLSDIPDNVTTYGMEDPSYAPDGSGLANAAWVMGSTYLSLVQTYTVPPSLVNGQNYQFVLPGNPEIGGMTLKVNGVDQGAGGVVPAAGDITDQTSFKNAWVIEHTPAILALKTTPASGQSLVLTGQFRYPLITRVSNSALIQAANGNIFEAVIRDRRIADLSLAQQVGNNYLLNQGLTVKGGTAKVRKRGVGGALLQPGQQITVKHDKLFGGGVLPGGGTTMTALITRLALTLDTDVNEPYQMQINFADRLVGGITS